jgi:tetratricopeptide (TPR) repeat protein
LWHVNVVLYAVIACVVAIYWAPLRWAAAHLPRYVQGDVIPAPEEVRLWGEARRILLRGESIDDAEPLLRRSLAIDPNTEAVYWLGRYHFDKRRDAEALEQFARYLEIEPTHTDSYLKIAAIHVGRDETGLARRILERGIVSFVRQRERYLPVPDPDVADEFNEKSVRTHRGYDRSIATLRRVLASLDD